MKRTTEDYLKTIYLLSRTNSSVRGVSIADQLSVSKPTVSIIVKRLISEGYAEMNGEHEIFLTETGEAIAETILERNMTFQQLLTELGVDEKIAAEDACRMEHAVSTESFAALKRLVEERQNERVGNAYDDE